TFYNLAFVPTDNVGGQDAEILLQLGPDHRPSAEYMARMRRELPLKFPSLQLYFMPADVVTQVLNFGSAAMIDVQIAGRNLDTSFAIARRLSQAMRRVPGVEDVRIPELLNHPALQIELDRQLAARVAVAMRDAANSVLTALSSSVLTAPNFWVNPAT